MRVFVDIGAHEGQTVEVVEPAWDYDAVHAVEPMPRQAEVLRRRWPGPPVFVHQFALGSSTGTGWVYGSNDRMEASVYPDKTDVDESVETAVFVVQASVFFRQRVAPGDTVDVKLNAEGAEISILEDMLDSGAIDLVSRLLVAWDCDRIPSLAGERARVEARLAGHGVEWTDFGTLTGATHRDRLEEWL